MTVVFYDTLLLTVTTVLHCTLYSTESAVVVRAQHIKVSQRVLPVLHCTVRSVGVKTTFSLDSLEKSEPLSHVTSQNLTVAILTDAQLHRQAQPCSLSLVCKQSGFTSVERN